MLITSICLAILFTSSLVMLLLEIKQAPLRSEFSQSELVLLKSCSLPARAPRSEFAESVRKSAPILVADPAIQSPPSTAV